MIERRTLGYLLISSVFGILAVTTAAQWIDEQAMQSTTRVVVAARDIQPGERLTPEHLRSVHWPLNAAVAGSSTEGGALEGRVVNTVVIAGEPITEKRLAPIGSRAGLNALISPGQRAITVKVNEVVGVAGFALPGNYVDILVTFKKGQENPVSKIVLEKILVLAIAQDHAVKDETKPKVVSAVTLEVSPEQAEKLDLARSIGTLSMVLRNQTDQARTNTRGASMTDVISPPNGSNPRSHTPTTALPPRIEIIRGIAVSSRPAI